MTIILFMIIMFISVSLAFLGSEYRFFMILSRILLISYMIGLFALMVLHTEYGMIPESIMWGTILGLAPVMIFLGLGSRWVVFGNDTEIMY